MRKSLFALIMTFVLCLGLAVTASADEPQNMAEVIYNGKEYTLVLGMYDEGTDKIDEFSGAAWPTTQTELESNAGQVNAFPFSQFAVTVFENIDGQNKSEVSEELRNQIIKSVTFSAENNDGNFIARIETSQGSGRWYAAPYLRYVDSSADLVATVEADGKTHTLRFSINHDWMPDDVYVDLSHLTSETELQNYINNLNAGSLNENYPGGILGFYIQLGPYDYGDITIDGSNIPSDAIVVMGSGYNDGAAQMTTQLSSLTITNSNVSDGKKQQSVISGIIFESEVNSGKAALTIDNSHAFSSISDCSFKGYDTAISLPDGAEVGSIYNCLFIENDLAIGYANAVSGVNIYNCAFDGNKNSIRLSNMPGNSSAYDYRIYHCDFINGNNSDKKDIDAPRDVTASGNYFDHPSDKAVNNKADISLRYLSPTGLTQYLMYRFGYDNSPVAAPDWAGKLIGIGSEAVSVTVDLNDELLFAGGDALIDGDSFDGRDGDLTIEVVDGDNTLGSWIFSAESEGE